MYHININKLALLCLALENDYLPMSSGLLCLLVNSHLKQVALGQLAYNSQRYVNQAPRDDAICSVERGVSSATSRRWAEGYLQKKKKKKDRNKDTNCHQTRKRQQHKTSLTPKYLMIPMPSKRRREKLVCQMWKTWRPSMSWSNHTECLTGQVKELKKCIINISITV